MYVCMFRIDPRSDSRAPRQSDVGPSERYVLQAVIYPCSHSEIRNSQPRITNLIFSKRIFMSVFGEPRGVTTPYAPLDEGIRRLSTYTRSHHGVLLNGTVVSCIAR